MVRHPISVPLRTWALMALLLLPGLLAACGTAPIMAAPVAPLPAVVPPIPFDDNPDPTLCGIPRPDNRRGVVTGDVAGGDDRTIVYFYDSHARQRVTGQVYPGAQVDIVLSQSNPTLDYFFVKTRNVEPAQEGWVPAPFVRVN